MRMTRSNPDWELYEFVLEQLAKRRTITTNLHTTRCHAAQERPGWPCLCEEPDVNESDRRAKLAFLEYAEHHCDPNMFNKVLQLLVMPFMGQTWAKPEWVETWIANKDSTSSS